MSQKVYQFLKILSLAHSECSHNDFGKCGSILITLSLLHFEMNCRRMYYNLSHFLNSCTTAWRNL